MTEGDLMLGTLLVLGFALLGLAITWGWARNAAETRRIREAVEEWVLQDLAMRREQEARTLQPPADLSAYLADLWSRAGKDLAPIRVLGVEPEPGTPAFRVLTDRGIWRLAPHPPPRRSHGIPLDALTTGDRWAAEILRRARMALEPGLTVPPVERWWLQPPEARRWGPLTRKRLWDRSGQALVELLLAFPLLVLMAAAVMAFGRIFHAGLQAEAAAHVAARFAAETLSAGRGVWQAQAAAQLALRESGLDPGRARVGVQAARWGRGERVRAQVCLRVSVSDIPFARWIVPAGFVDQCATAYREIQRWKSQWEP